MQRSLVLSIAALLLVGCSNGTWNDDPDNWERAFGESRPADGITIVHSWYWRSPHFTAEYRWIFELRLTEDVKKEVTANPDFALLSEKDGLSRSLQSGPSWFAPEPRSAFDVYESKSEENFLMLVERIGARSFWSNYRL
jgi:hypothetical protein